MKEYWIFVCDDMGEEVYKKKVKAASLEEAKDMAYKWSVEVESQESWFTTYKAKEEKAE